MKQITLESIVGLAKQLLTKYGAIEPMLYLNGTEGTDALPLPDLPNDTKLSVLDALGYTVAREKRVGDLTQLFLIAEGWRSNQNGEHAANRIEVVMVYRYDLAADTKSMVLYDLIRDARGTVAELRLVTSPDKEPHDVFSPTMDALLAGYQRGRAA